MMNLTARLALAAYLALTFKAAQALLPLSSGVILDPNVGCSSAGGTTGTHCVIMSASAFTTGTIGSGGDQPRCARVDSDGRGSYKCQFQDGDTAQVNCDPLGSNNLKVTFGQSSSYVSSLTGDISYYFQQDLGQSTTYPDDNIIVNCSQDPPILQG